MPWITILDFTTGEVHIHEYEEEDKDACEIVNDLGYKESECQYICTDKLKLQIHD